MPIYLDHAATTPLRPEARDAWLRAQETVGNASSVHADGQAARRLLEDARDQLAEVLGAQSIEIIFTSGGTESINLALKGLWWGRGDDRDAVVLPDAEHHATTEAAAWLQSREGAVVRSVPVTAYGAIDPESFARALPQAAWATALIANNEVGTVNDVTSLARSAATAGVPLHLDAVAAFGHLPLDFRKVRGDAEGNTGLVALSVSGHKVGAPVGTGALVVSRHATLSALQHGGAHQRGLRAGTQDIAGAAALAAAAVAAERSREKETARLSALRDHLWHGIETVIPGAELLGDPQMRLPGNLHVHFPGAAGETLLFLLDMAGISTSTGSACQAGVTEPSHVVRAMGRGDDVARSVLRFTLGRTTTSADVEAVTAAIGAAYERALASGARAGSRS